MLPGSQGGNINGPSLIRSPEWLPNPLGRYYLYFAHHTGGHIRLAVADELTGPWRIYELGTLALADCPSIAGHIASPEVVVDDASQRFVMYFHGPTIRQRKVQRTFVSVSIDGLSFVALPEILGPSYSRVFFHGRTDTGMGARAWCYAIFGAGPHHIARSADGISHFASGPRILEASPGEPYARHVAVRRRGDWLDVFYTRKGDAPERILHGVIDLTGDWLQWRVQGSDEVMRPQMPYEGADLPVAPSRPGPAKGRENALRDPCIFEEDGRTWLLYAIAGESGIALAELVPADG